MKLEEKLICYHARVTYKYLERISKTQLSVTAIINKNISAIDDDKVST